MTTDHTAGEARPAHTPTPWKAPVLWDAYGVTKNAIIQDCQPGGTWKRDTADICYFPPDPLNRANAEFIVRACNFYGEMVKEGTLGNLAAKLQRQAAALVSRCEALEAALTKADALQSQVRIVAACTTIAEVNAIASKTATAVIEYCEARASAALRQPNAREGT